MGLARGILPNQKSRATHVSCLVVLGHFELLSALSLSKFSLQQVAILDTASYHIWRFPREEVEQTELLQQKTKQSQAHRRWFQPYLFYMIYYTPYQHTTTCRKDNTTTGSAPKSIPQITTVQSQACTQTVKHLASYHFTPYERYT